jgi:non-ribosomal peptide synthetase component F
MPDHRQLDYPANQAAHHLRGLGVAPNSMVGVFIERSVPIMPRAER